VDISEIKEILEFELDYVKESRQYQYHKCSDMYWSGYKSAIYRVADGFDIDLSQK